MTNLANLVANLVANLLAHQKALRPTWPTFLTKIFLFRREESRLVHITKIYMFCKKVGQVGRNALQSRKRLASIGWPGWPGWPHLISQIIKSILFL